VTGLLVRDCTVENLGRVDVRLRDGVIVEIAAGLRGDGEDVLPAHGGALLPGLHDHHLHLFALAAYLGSVDCSPSAVRDADGLATTLRRASQSGPVRGVGYHESVAGNLDRDALDAMVDAVPVRVQHRSGALWFLNSAALASTGLLESTGRAVERDTEGRATGRLVRGDHLLPRDEGTLPDLTDVGRLLASYGVTGVTDATPRLASAPAAALQAAAAEGQLRQRLLLLGAPLTDPASLGVPWKIVVDELAGLDPAAVTDEVRAAHEAGRPVAIHCTSRAETVLAVAALREAGVVSGDRLEHAGVLPRDFDDELARAGVTVVTQPHFVADRGDDYLADVEPVDHDLLYRCGSLLDAGVPVAAGTDAPYGRPDPWRAIAAAVQRRTANGVVITGGERIAARRALDLFLGSPLDPGGRSRAIEIGAPADLCLLRVPLDEVFNDPSAELVAATVIDGAVAYG
jgi:predicted amidohydrolase YtcJ